jgi:hypothetical protein
MKLFDYHNWISFTVTLAENGFGVSVMLSTIEDGRNLFRHFVFKDFDGVKDFLGGSIETSVEEPKCSHAPLSENPRSTVNNKTGVCEVCKQQILPLEPLETLEERPKNKRREVVPVFYPPGLAIKSGEEFDGQCDALNKKGEDLVYGKTRCKICLQLPGEMHLRTVHDES